MRVLLFIMFSLAHAGSLSAKPLRLFPTEMVSSLPCANRLIQSTQAMMRSTKASGGRAILGISTELWALLVETGATAEQARYIQNVLLQVLKGGRRIPYVTQHFSSWYRALADTEEDIPLESRLIFCVLSPDCTTNPANVIHPETIPGYAILTLPAVGNVSAIEYIVDLLSGLEGFAAEHTLFRWLSAGKQLQDFGSPPDEFWTRFVGPDSEQFQFTETNTAILLQMIARGSSLALDSELIKGVGRLHRNKRALDEVFSQTYPKMSFEKKAFFHLLGVHADNYSDRAMLFNQTIHRTISSATALTN